MNQNNETLIRTWFDDIWNKRRTQGIHELLAPEGKAHLEGAEIVGPAQFHDYHVELITAFPDFRITVDEVISQGESAAVRWTVDATHKGAGLGLEPSGQVVRFRGMTWVHIRDGKIIEGWDSWNMEALVQQLKSAASSR